MISDSDGSSRQASSGKQKSGQSREMSGNEKPTFSPDVSFSPQASEPFPAAQAPVSQTPPESHSSVIQPAQPSRWRLILILALLAAFGPLAIDMYLPAFPQIAHELGASQSAVQLSLSMFLIGVALGQLLYGPISDAVGRREPLLFGLGLFAVAAAGCVFSGSVQALIGWRLLMALGGAAGMALSRAIIRDHFAEHEAADALSLIMVVMGAAPILAPMLGGQLLLFTGWRSIFGVLALAGVLAWLAVWWGLPESLPMSERNRWSWRGALSGYWHLVQNRRFVGYALGLGFNAGAMFTYITCSSHLFMDLHGVSPQRFPFFFGLNALGLMGVAHLNRLLLRRFETHQILGGALAAVMGAGALLLIVALTGVGGFPALVALLFLTLASGGMVGPNATALALAPCRHVAGSAAALMGTLQFGMGGLIGALAGRFDPSSALPMCATLAVCAVAGYMAFRWAEVAEETSVEI